MKESDNDTPAIAAKTKKFRKTKEMVLDARVMSSSAKVLMSEKKVSKIAKTPLNLFEAGRE